MHAVAEIGGRLPEVIKDYLPEGFKVLSKKEDFKTGSLAMIVYSEHFGVVPCGNKLPTMLLEPEEIEPAKALAYPH